MKLTSQLHVERGSKYLVWSFWTSFIFFILTASLPSSVSPVPYEMKKWLRVTLPQGWGFFTRTPREAMISAYRIDNGILRLVTFPNTCKKNWAGFSRSSRYVTYELGKIMSKSSKDGWNKVVGDLNKNIPKELITIKYNNSLKYFLKGDYIIVKQKEIPWAWARTDQSKNQPYEIKRIRVL